MASLNNLYIFNTILKHSQIKKAPKAILTLETKFIINFYPVDKYYVYPINLLNH